LDRAAGTAAAGQRQAGPAAAAGTPARGHAVMPRLIDCERHGPVALLTLNHAPVNSLAQPVRQALWDALVAADADAAVSAIVLAGAGRGFCAGGELGEMRTPLQQAWPGISSHLLPRIEACAKPVIAAL